MKNGTTLGVVFDCNILLQAVARKAGPAAACLRLAEAGFVRLHLSPEILNELSGVLQRPTIRSRYPELTDEVIQEFLKALIKTAELTTDVPKRFNYPRDIDDEPYLNLAIETEARYLISRDKDLLSLMTGHSEDCKQFRQRFRLLSVLEPISFLKEIRRFANG